ncbi:sulfur carrier protein [Litorimonas taeanensis]|uniref:Sulfur carrier protein n=1 Tax=Litorimonas taeanensis TaxID=568099 RepID=A0A420WJB4_9PROT|nr:sulfur carrier protein ThiS [Litorimonas taeanensis]RKQ71097.1 sulfur carrier protein [Litorimonas taeanensis]
MVTRPATQKTKGVIVEIMVNGDFHSFDEGLTIAQMLVKLDLPLKKIAVERNLEVVPKSAYEDVVLQEGDKLEIIHFIGGG